MSWDSALWANSEKGKQSRHKYLETHKIQEAARNKKYRETHKGILSENKNKSYVCMWLHCKQETYYGA